jgi:hypothetical protein
VDREELIELFVAHGFRFTILRISFITSLDVSNQFPYRQVFEIAKTDLQLSSDLDYF